MRRSVREPRAVIQLTLPMRARGWTEENLAGIGTPQDAGNAAQEPWGGDGEWRRPSPRGLGHGGRPAPQRWGAGP